MNTGLLGLYIGSGATPTAINDVLFSTSIVYRTDEPIELDAIPVGVSLTRAQWEIRRMSDNKLIRMTLTASTTITPITTEGLYKIKFIGQTSNDQYIREWKNVPILLPQFEEAEADIVVNLAAGNYYQNFSSADNSGLKIYVKGSGTAQFQVANLFGSQDNPVRVQKEIGNTNIVQDCPNGTAHAVYIYGDNECILFDGFNTDKTQGWHINGHPTNSAQVFAVKDGASSDIKCLGLALSHATTINAASFSFIPVTNATYNATNYVAENMWVIGCTITDAGEEGVYMGYNNDTLQSGYRPYKFRNCIIAWNTITRCGRDGIQPGGCVNVMVHNNFIDTWGVQQDGSHESAISWNGGNYGQCFENYCINGEMFLNIQSGATPWDIEAGQTTPQKAQFYSNVFINGTYTGSPGTEPFAIYCQNSGSETTSSANWPVEIYNNTFKSDKKLMEAYFHASSFVWTGFKMVNNICVKVGNAGDYAEVNFTGPGTQPTGSTINNLVRETSAVSDILFTDYAGNDLTISSLSSPAYTGATDVSGYDGDYGVDGLPLNADGFTHGAYSGYNKKIITPIPGDPNPATFTSPVVIGSITQYGGTLSFETDKEGVLFWTVLNDGDTPPTDNQIISGTFGVSNGQITDAGTADTGPVDGLVENTDYNLYCIFVTVDGVKQASITQVDFTTAADTTAPTVLSMSISDSARNQITIIFNEIVIGTNLGFTIAGTTSTSFSSISGSGSTTIIGTMADDAQFGEVITLSYNSAVGDITDASDALNELATFGPSSVTNNVAAEPSEPIVVDLNSNITVSGTNNNDLTSTSTSAYATSVQVIPSTSGGYVQFDWDQETRNSFNIRIGFIDAADTSPAASDVKLWLALLTANHNIDIYEGNTYKSTFGSFGYNQAGTKYRISINRATQKITVIASGNNFVSSVTVYTSTTNFTGDFRFVFHTTVNGAQCINAYIQADNGLT